MSQLTARFAQLNKRTRVLLVIIAALALLAVAGGVSLAVNPTLLARLTHTLPGTAVELDWTQPGYAGSLRPSHTSEMCLARDNNLTYGTGGNLNGLWPCTNEENRTWKLIPQWSYEDQQWIILTNRTLADGAGKLSFALDVPNGTEEENASVISWPIDTKQGAYPDNERWWIIRKDDQGGPKYQIENVKSMMCLSVQDQGTGNGAGIVQRECGLRDQDQLWQLDQ